MVFANFLSNPSSMHRVCVASASCGVTNTYCSERNPITIRLLNHLSLHIGGIFDGWKRRHYTIYGIKEDMRRTGIVLIFFSCIAIASFWIRGIVPFSGDFMRAWFEPWKTDTAVRGVPTIPHKAIGDDVFRQIYPAKILSADLVRQGSLPFWNPYDGAGQPLFAIQHYGPANPVNIAFLLFSPTHAWTILFVGQFTVLAFFIVLYATSVGLSRGGTLCAAAVWLVSGYVVANAMFGTYLYAYAGLPFVLWSIDRVLEKKHWSIGWVPVAVAWVILTGFPQLSLYILVVGIAYAVYRSPTRWIWLAPAGFLGLGLTAFQLIPMAELYTRAAITTQTSAFIFRNFLLPLPHYITVLIPNFFGNPATYNYWGPSEYIESVSSVGSIAVVFAAVAFFYPRKQKRSLMYFFAAVIIGSVALSFRWWGSEWLYRLPIPVLTTGAPSRVMAMATFAIAVLSGMGVDAFLRAKDTRVFVRLLILFGFVLTAFLIVTLVSARVHIPCHNPVITSCYMIAFRNTLLETAVFAAAAGILLHSVFRVSWLSRRNALYAVVALLILSGGYNAYKFLPFAKAEHVMPEHPLFTALRALAPQRVGYVGDAVIQTDLATYYHFFEDNYYDPLYIRRYGELVSYANTGDRKKGILRSDVTVIPDATVSADIAYRRDRLWDLTGTSALVVRQNGRLGISRRTTALPRAYLVSEVRVEKNPEKELAALFAPSTDIRTTAFVEAALPTSATGSGTATIASYTPTRVEVQVRTSAPSFLVLSDTDYPGWNARIDGKETQVYRTNYAFRGVTVPEGNHTVVFWYDPDSFKAGVWVTGTALLIVLFIGFLIQ